MTNKSKATIYRADDYYRNAGDILGFFRTKKEAAKYLRFSKPCKQGDGDFSQITAFHVDKSSLKDLDLKDTAEVMPIWAESEIVKTYYFTK